MQYLHIININIIITLTTHHRVTGGGRKLAAVQRQRLQPRGALPKGTDIVHLKIFNRIFKNI